MSFTKVIKIVGKKYYPTRGKKVDNLIEKIKNEHSFKTTLGNCIIKRVSKTIIVLKEQ